MNEEQYFEQFSGDEPLEIIVVAFSPDCPFCHGSGFVESKAGGIIVTSPCYRCWTLIGR